MPIDFAVAENSTFKLYIPIKVKTAAKAGDNVHEATLGFCGKKGKPFGEKIIIKFVVEKPNYEDFFKTALNLFQAQSVPELPLEDILTILKDVNNNAALAGQLIEKKKQKDN